MEKKLPNSLGLYDMCGNVDEWCWDKTVYSGRNYDEDADGVTDPTGIETGDRRICRGSYYYMEAKYSTVTYRHGNQPHDKYGRGVGFRVVRTVVE